MRPADQLQDFVREALAKGAEPGAISAAILGAGWSPDEARDALAGWSKPADLPPLPMPGASVSARDGVGYALMFVALVMLTWNLAQLGFALLDALIPDPAELYASSDAMRWPIAAILAFLPLWLVLDRRLRQRAVAMAPRRPLLRGWFASVTLLIALLALMGDLVSAIYALLSGGLTLRFLAKALLVGLLAGLVLAYYRDDLDG